MAPLIFHLHNFKLTIFIFLVILLAQGTFIQAHEPNKLSTNVAPPSHFVLVHGASFGGWCWYKVRALLESAGYNVTAPDLKTAGIDSTNPNTLFSFEDYNQPLYDILSNLPEGEKVILVGHSYGGFSITDAILKFPEKIQVAVYLAAAMVRNPIPFWLDQNHIKSRGLQIPVNDLDCFFEMGPFIPTSCIFKRDTWHTKFFNKSPLEDYTLASMLIKPFPFRAFFGFPWPRHVDVPRVFIRTSDDQLSSPFTQDIMIRLWPPSQTFTAAGSDHMAMLSAPSELYDIFVKIAANYALSSKA